MKAELKITFLRALLFAALIALCYVIAGCTSPAKMRDIELKGLYVNGYSEVLAIGSGRLTSIPGEREALAAHYEEDTAWLQPNIKTHKIDIFMVGTNSSQNATQVIESICKAFAEVAPAVSKENAEVAKSVATVTPLGVVKSGGEVRKAEQLAKGAAKEIKALDVTTGTNGTDGTQATATTSDPHCAGCVDSAARPDCEVK